MVASEAAGAPRVESIRPACEALPNVKEVRDDANNINHNIITITTSRVLGNPKLKIGKHIL